VRLSSVTRRALLGANFRTWAWWQLPRAPRLYVAAVVLAAVAAFGYAASQTTVHTGDLLKFLLLITCGLISVAATPRIAYVSGGMTRDFITVWVLPVAILLPPVYCMLAAIPLFALTQWRIYRAVIHRLAFTAAGMALCYGLGSVVFHRLIGPGSQPIGTGYHAIEWVLAVALAEIIGGRGQNTLIVGAVKISNHAATIKELVLSRETLQADFAEFDLAILMTVVVGVNSALAVLAVPTVLLIRRFMMHAQLLAKSRIDTKTGLLNASTWESEANTEIARSIRSGTPIAVALIDIDHFKLVNDTHGHLAGDKVLRAMSDEIREQLRSTDIPGRFGGEEFVVLLPNARESDAIGVAERLRGHVEETPIPISDNPAAASRCVELTISIGVAALDDDCHELTDLLAAADAALYHAKETGRNKVHALSATAHKQRFAVTAQADPASALASDDTRM